ncbi:tRNA pseudouridine(38-40) synthase TruA [Pedobacter sp. MR2016-24]|uniref:tRNA pseudouridine(38-40) synthase TruA n=1 Tax=Pedobacter sp. MR2016-24 TaxID=2994466 RepID=UPI00224656FE|nr:tRNA pseudouridine(38-40) synthase TruA [Pedobacter sp. MR2016-24]MCX2485461.1 tRNA pseudouridine(38-40) synthase TruA [Pedobacter sp. MR2016-24]
MREEGKLRYFVHIGYNGSQYGGWQRQPGVMNVQGVIEHALSQIFKTNIAINGCGRTDAQVHASQFFFHMDLETEWDFDLVFRLNKVLPRNIAVFDIIPMEGLPHARFDAVQRSYDYFLHTYKDPFLNGLSSYYLLKDLKFDQMKAAVDLLPNYRDYRSFCTSPDKYEHTLCYVRSASLMMDENGDKLRFQISANRFLGKMIRIIMGQLLKIGKGTLSVDEFESYLINKQTPALITPAHPHGLYLSKVTYPFLDLPPRVDFSAILQKQQDSSWRIV